MANITRALSGQQAMKYYLSVDCRPSSLRHFRVDRLTIDTVDALAASIDRHQNFNTGVVGCRHPLCFPSGSATNEIILSLGS